MEFSKFLIERKKQEKWIQKAIKHPGALHKALHVPKDEKIPASKLTAAAKKGGKIGKRARLAQTLKGLKEEQENRHNYMFFGNLRTIKNAIDEILKMDEAKIDKKISDGHDWANDHISEAKNNIEQVYHWITARKD